MKYILGIDQSTQGTKALLFDEKGVLLARADRPHRQIISEAGWVSHDIDEIYANTVAVARDVIEKAGADKADVAALGISNQRETTAVWYPDGTKAADAIVWQCARATAIGERIEKAGYGLLVKERTGIPLSPYFPASKLAWFLENVEGLKAAAEKGELRFGTMDTYLVYKLTGGAAWKTDYSNASRTQLFNINTLTWDREIFDIFGIPTAALPEVVDSDACYGYTDLEGYLPSPIPIHGVLGDSHAALFGQGCILPGMAKSTYGTGSSIMMNVGDKPVTSKSGLVTSLAWGMGGSVNYVLEGNINYTGAVISWLKDNVKLIESAGETEALARSANPADVTYLVPAFTGLGAPYWRPEVRGIITGMTRTTGKCEIVRAALDAIVYQITDIVKSMEEDFGQKMTELRVDGGPTKNAYLMQFQSDIARLAVRIPSAEELSGIGAAYAAGIGIGLYDREQVLTNLRYRSYSPEMSEEEAGKRYLGWQEAVKQVLA